MDLLGIGEKGSLGAGNVRKSLPRLSDGIQLNYQNKTEILVNLARESTSSIEQNQQLTIDDQAGSDHDCTGGITDHFVHRDGMNSQV